ncbi:uroporphyrinogen-III synthase [Neobacillus sp. DY30]|uniref:uroporphyrinogen-III synthase n=1 Tax=Neobacillus sp. DY30 TaxID=3047871 RepID=UPI0024BFCE27|nr:uroporphyrinogen-III synthase [Neobacillus sp. DY30]WHX99504.1 uroporphyrinogen-III synthase [Neobacillus sp. DY30]
MLKPLGLKDKKVLVPRGVGQAKSFSQLVEKYGGISIEIPLIAFRPIQLTEQLKRVLAEINTYDWIVFTSNVTVETFFSFYQKKDHSSFPRIAVIGKKTEEVLQEKGFKAEFVPSAYVTEVFTDEFLPIVPSGSKVLIPKGNLAREYISTTLSNHGVLVNEIVIYETYMPEESTEKLAQMLFDNELDILMFTSPSTVDHFMSVVKAYKLENHIKRCVTSCIGPVTEKRLRAYGLPVHVSPEEYTVKEMIKSTIQFLEK